MKSRCGRQIMLLAGLLVSMDPLALPQPSLAQGAAREDGFTLAFVDADVRRVVDAVLGAMMSVDYTVDPAVTGNITLRTTQPVGRDALLPMLESALASVDAVIVRQGGSYRVIPRKAARGISLPAMPTAGNAVATAQETVPGFASEIVTLRYASAREMARLLEEFVGKDIVSSRNDAINQIVIAGTGEERSAARQVIARFDVDSLAQMQYEIYRLDNVDAAILVGELHKIFAPPYDIIGSRVRLVPLPRLRSLLAIASDRTDLGRIEPWIKKLDVGTSGVRKLYNYAVQNGRARDLARSLQLVLGQQASSFAPETSPAETATVPSPQMAALAGGSTSAGASALPVTSGESAAIAPTSSSDTMSFASSSGGVRIVPNEANNSLLIYADGEEYAFIKDALTELDQPVAQVLIEATLAEVTLGNDLQFGVDFKTISGDLSVNSVSNTAGVPASSFPGLSTSLVSQSTTAILNALQSKTNVRVLSAPRLFVLNNQPATLQVGDQVPIVVQQAQSVAAPGAPVVNTVELRDTGVILQVTPRVNQSGVVTLDIAQEVSDVARTTTSGINSPTIQQRRLTSTVATRSGQVVALGGLIRERATRTRSGVPLLSQIPIIGAAFGSQSNGGSKTELIILLKPTVIRSPDEVKGMVDALIDGLEVAGPLVEKAQSREMEPTVRPPRARQSP
jgi:general secretion pathway protein D